MGRYAVAYVSQVKATRFLAHPPVLAIVTDGIGDGNLFACRVILVGRGESVSEAQDAVRKLGTNVSHGVFLSIGKFLAVSTDQPAVKEPQGYLAIEEAAAEGNGRAVPAERGQIGDIVSDGEMRSLAIGEAARCQKQSGIAIQPAAYRAFIASVMCTAFLELMRLVGDGA